ncbi:MAG: hypothetical protein H7245_02090 [Candidatus Saccharibacteria bacterium]|nr:hypothetical protein [Pseudorhodobacter sp.]
MNTLDKTPSSVAGVDLIDPLAVVREPTMTTDEKRALLASWASDRRAIPDNPALRQLDDGRHVAIDDVLEALRRLDQMPDDPTLIRRRAQFDLCGKWLPRGRPGRWDDDDDDPPTPAPAAIRPRPPVLEGGATAVAVAA